MSEPLCVHCHVYFSTFEQQKLTQHALETGTLTSHRSSKGLVEKIHEKLKAVYCCTIVLAVWSSVFTWYLIDDKVCSRALD